MKRGLGDWSLLSRPNKDGSRHIGIRALPDAANQIHARSFVVANKMYERSVDRGLMSNIRIGDVFDVRFDGDKGWWAWRGGVRLGRLTWSLSNIEAREWREAMPRIDEGTLQVIRLVVDAGGIVVNAAGIVRPLGDAIPPVKKAVPDAQQGTRRRPSWARALRRPRWRGDGCRRLARVRRPSDQGPGGPMS